MTSINKMHVPPKLSSKALKTIMQNIEVTAFHENIELSKEDSQAIREALVAVLDKHGIDKDD